MPLIKNGALATDPWQALADDAPVPAAGAVTVSYDRWLREREVLKERRDPIGLRVGNTQAIAAIVDDLKNFGVVVLHFPKFTDGRAYSQARLLRERHGYTGELRASGVVLRDQLLFMHRCGFDAFEVDAKEPVEVMRKAMAEFDHFYQPTGDHRPARLVRP